MFKNDEKDNEEISKEPLAPSDEGELTDSVISEIKASLAIIQSNLVRIHKLLDSGESSSNDALLSLRSKIRKEEVSGDGESPRVIEGVFDGQIMIGPDGQKYQVPPNYASKSKLVEGDILKLTITKTGSFIYKQIGPIDRERVVGTLVRDELTGDFKVKVKDKFYKVLQASITYFKGDEGDEIVILIPKNADSKWAAIENILKN